MASSPAAELGPDEEMEEMMPEVEATTVVALDLSSPAVVAEEEELGQEKETAEDMMPEVEAEVDQDCPPPHSFPAIWTKRLDDQRKEVHFQIEELQRVVSVQCRMMGINPLAVEMAAAVLGSQAGRRFGELTPKASKCLHDVFSVKHTITKKEAREISAMCGASVSQVRGVFAIEGSHVRRHLHQLHEVPVSSGSEHPREDDLHKEQLDSENLPCHAESSNRLKTEKGGDGSIDQPLSSNTGINLKGSDCEGIAKGLISLMEKEIAFSGQLNLAEVILQTRSKSTLRWFVSKGGVQLIGKWLANAASNEQTSLLRLLMKVLFHLPLGFVLPQKMSSLLNTINKLRFYCEQDIAGCAWLLLSKWSRFFRESAGGRTFPHAGSTTLSQNIQKRNRDVIFTQEDANSTTKKHKTKLADNSSTKMELITGSASLEKESTEMLDGEVCLPNSVKRQPAQSVLLNDTTGVKRGPKVRLLEEAGLVLRRAKIANRDRAGHPSSSRPVCTDDIKKIKRKAFLLQSFKAPNRLRTDSYDDTKTESPIKCMADEPGASDETSRNLSQATLVLAGENDALPGKSIALETKTAQNLFIQPLISMQKSVAPSVVPIYNFATCVLPLDKLGVQAMGDFKREAEPSVESQNIHGSRLEPEAICDGSVGNWNSSNISDEGFVSDKKNDEAVYNSSSGNQSAESTPLLCTVSNEKCDEVFGSSTLNVPNDDIIVDQTSLVEDVSPFIAIQTIPWSVPPRVVLDLRWRVAAGEESTGKYMIGNEENADREISSSSNPEEPQENASLLEDDTNVPEILLEDVVDESQEINEAEYGEAESGTICLHASESKSLIPLEVGTSSVICPDQAQPNKADHSVLCDDVHESPLRETQKVQSKSVDVKSDSLSLSDANQELVIITSVDAKMNDATDEEHVNPRSLPESHTKSFKETRPSNNLDGDASRDSSVVQKNLQMPSESVTDSAVQQKQSSHLLASSVHISNTALKASDRGSCEASSSSKSSKLKQEKRHSKSEKEKTSGISPSVRTVQALKKELPHTKKIDQSLVTPTLACSLDSVSSLLPEQRSTVSSLDSSTKLPTEIIKSKDEDNLGIDVSKLSKEECWDMLKVVLGQLSDSTGLGADMELLAVFLKNPDLVHALTTGQAPTNFEGLSALSEFLEQKFPKLHSSNIKSLQSEHIARDVPERQARRPPAGSMPKHSVQLQAHTVISQNHQMEQNPGPSSVSIGREALKADWIHPQSFHPGGPLPPPGSANWASHRSFMPNPIPSTGPMLEQGPPFPPFRSPFHPSFSGSHEMAPFARPFLQSSVSPMYPNMLNAKHGDSVPWRNNGYRPDNRGMDSVCGRQGGSWIHHGDIRGQVRGVGVGVGAGVGVGMVALQQGTPNHPTEFVSRPPPLPPGAPPSPLRVASSSTPLRSPIQPEKVPQHDLSRLDARPPWKN